MKFSTLLFTCLITLSIQAQDFVNGSYEASCLINTPPTSWGGASTSAGVDCDFWATGLNPGPSPDGGHFIRHQTAHIESINQTITGLSFGETYDISLYIAGGTGGNFIIYIDGVLVETYPGASPYEWHLITKSFVAGATSANIKFEWNLPLGTADGAVDGASLSGGCAVLTTTVSASEICLGELVTLTSVSTTGGVVTWDGGVANGVAFEPVTAGTFTYTATSTSIADCAGSATIIVHELPIIDAGIDAEVCMGDGITLTATGAGVDGVYSWDGGVMNGVEFSPVATMIYTVTGIDGNGCSNDDLLMVTVHALPEISAGYDQEICAGESVTLSGSGAGVDGTYSWDGGVIDGVEFTPGATMTYTIIGTDENDCSGENFVLITVYDLPIIDAGGDQVICDGQSVILNGSGAGVDGTYSWDGGVSDGVEFNPETTMTYTVTGIDVNECLNTDEVEVVVNPTPAVVFIALEDDVVCSDHCLIWLSGTPEGGDFSGDGVTGEVFLPTEAGIGEHTLYYTAGNEFGCSATDSVLVTVTDCLGLNNQELSNINLAPNPFKDYTILNFGTNVQSEHRVLIYDMLGKEVYRNESVLTQQLRINSENLVPGTYVLFVFDTSSDKSYSTKLIVQ